MGTQTHMKVPLDLILVPYLAQGKGKGNRKGKGTGKRKGKRKGYEVIVPSLGLTWRT